MSQVRRFCLVAALSTALSVAAHAAIEHDTLVQRKQSIVGVSVEKLGCLDARSALLEAAAKAEALVAIAVDVSQETPVVTLQVTGRPHYRVFSLDKGRRLVLDLTDTVNLHPGNTVVATNQSVVRQVRSSLFALQPRLVSRAVIDLATPCTYHVEQADGILSVRLKPTHATPREKTRPEKEPATVVAKKEDDVAALCSMLEDLRTEQRADAGRESASLASPETVPPSRVGPALKTAFEQTHTAVASLASVTVDVIEQAAHGYLEQARRSPPCPAAGPQVIVGRPKSSSNLPALPSSEAEVHIRQLTSQLQAVKESQFELTVASLPTFAAVTEEAPSTSSDPSAEAAPSMDTPPSGVTGNALPDTAASLPEPAVPDTSAPSAPPVESPVPESPAPVPEELRKTVEMIGTWIRKGDENPAENGLTIVAHDAPPSAEPPVAEPVPAPPTPPVPAPVPQEAPSSATPPAAPERPMPPSGDLMDQIVNLDFREMPLSNVVALLAQKADVNVIGPPQFTGVVTAQIKNITLRKAMDTVLRMSGLGMIEEEGIFRIVPYDDALAARRKTRMVTLNNAKATMLKATLEEILSGSLDATRMTFAIDEPSNMLIISGPEERVDEFEQLALELDVAKPVMPTITEVIKLNNADPQDIEALVKSMLTPETGQVAIDVSSQTLVVTDLPAAVDNVLALVAQIDMPPKQVAIEAMIVDAVLKDEAQTGIDWLLDSVRKLNTRGDIIGSLQSLGTETDVSGGGVTPGFVSDISTASRVTFGILTGQFDLKGAIGAQVDTQNAQILANPVVVTLENQKASIMITSELPYQEAKQSTTGPPMTSTEFKDVGITLDVTPKVSNDNFIIAEIQAKQSDTKGELNGIPIEDKREAKTTLRMKSGQTIFIGGLRRFDNEITVRKVPILGDIPVMNVLFRNNVITKEITELMIFLTCNVIPDILEPLTEAQQENYDRLGETPRIPDAQRGLFHEIRYPEETRDPAWKWHRTE